MVEEIKIPPKMPGSTLSAGEFNKILSKLNQLVDANNNAETLVDSKVEIDIDFKVLEEFVYNVPQDMILTSMICEESDAILSIDLNTELTRFTKLTITPTSIGLVILKGEII